MGDCCDPEGYNVTFSDRFARRLARRYRRRGLTRSSRAIVSFLTERGINDATILEIGGGVGSHPGRAAAPGAARATNLEISTSYEPEAIALLEHAGLRDRVDRRILDIAQSPDAVDAADVVVLHRVVCCYPDYERLLDGGREQGRTAAGVQPSAAEPRHPGRALVGQHVATAEGRQLPRLRRTRQPRCWACSPTPACVRPTGGAGSAGAWSGSNADRASYCALAYAATPVSSMTHGSSPTRPGVVARVEVDDVAGTDGQLARRRRTGRPSAPTGRSRCGGSGRSRCRRSA